MESVSVQAIQMILKNLQMNLMEPNHVTIHSKLKEFFGLQVTSKDWSDFVECLAFNVPFQHKLNYYHQLIGSLKVECLNGVFIFHSSVGEWVAEDLLSVDSEDEHYQLYLNKMEEFFNKKESD